MQMMEYMVGFVEKDNAQTGLKKGMLILSNKDKGSLVLKARDTPPFGDDTRNGPALTEIKTVADFFANMDRVLPKTVEEIVNKKPSRAPLGPSGAPEMGHIAAYMEMLDDFNTLKGKTPPAVFEEAKKEYLDKFLAAHQDANTAVKAKMKVAGLTQNLFERWVAWSAEDAPPEEEMKKIAEEKEAALKKAAGGKSSAAKKEEPKIVDVTEQEAEKEKAKEAAATKAKVAKELEEAKLKAKASVKKQVEEEKKKAASPEKKAPAPAESTSASSTSCCKAGVCTEVEEENGGSSPVLLTDSAGTKSASIDTAGRSAEEIAKSIIKDPFLLKAADEAILKKGGKPVPRPSDPFAKDSQLSSSEVVVNVKKEEPSCFAGIIQSICG